MIEIKSEPICCIRCSKPVNESDPLEFSCGLACESCIREHYRESYRRSYGKVPGFNREFEAFIQEELGYRRRTGPRTLKGILRQRAKEQRKQERRWGY